MMDPISIAQRQRSPKIDALHQALQQAIADLESHTVLLKHCEDEHSLDDLVSTGEILRHNMHRALAELEFALYELKLEDQRAH